MPLITLLFSLAANQVAFAANTGCSSAASFVGSCSGAQIKNNTVDVWSRSSTPGGSTEVVTPSGSNTPTRSGKQVPYYPNGTITFNCMARLATVASCKSQPKPPAVTPASFDPITLEDLANFVPQQASLVSQPRGWTVVNLDTNFIAGASTHVVGGSLFGRSAEVRFTPHAYDWNYGDGSTNSTAVPGARWDALGVREFSPTATSHIYRQEGSFTTTVVVRYGAEYRIGGGAWIPVSGEVSSAATALVTTVQSADTVLAARDCNNARGSQTCR
ncbi:hypothetical protein [Aurantimicrobium sp. MWH-Uga1]|uniref:hypothetical protein n=1 Tax=Aurantimicrobium sp. MWH-Uga1 TaxID=2079575 RepID=UPI0013B053CD|nr:hypothetical protein [Aurantimicrobium sp. MWH-Uga1]